VTEETPERLYTWIDVEAHLSTLAAARRWPAWLLEADAYWDGIDLSVTRGVTQEAVLDWFESTFGPNSIRRDSSELVLDSAAGSRSDRSVKISIRHQDDLDGLRRTPRFSERRIVRSIAEALPRPDQATFTNDVDIICLHSFKGGAGRTVLAIAIADALSERGHKALLVDGDLEAPGITWMLESQGRRADIAYDDFLALLHSSEDGSSAAAVSIVSAYLPNQEIGNTYVLPATRRSTKPAPPRIHPGDLLTVGRSRYFLSESLADLANSVNARFVIVDLRAGVSELDAPVLLDPRVRRVFVTTLSDQSVRGMTQFIREVGRLAPSTRESDPPSVLIVTQVNERDHAERIAIAAGALRDALASTLQPISEEDPNGSSSVDEDVVARPILVPFESRLLALPASWDAVVQLEREAGVAGYLRDLIDDIAEPHELPATQQARLPDLETMQSRRRQLAAAASALVYAETTSETDFLVTDSLRNLLTTHRTEPPIVVSVGAKGSGKTFTFLQMCLRRTWSDFAVAANVGGVSVDAPIFPVLTSVNLSSERAEAIQEIRTSAIGSIKAAPTQLQLRELITSRLVGDPMSDSDWRRVWLTAFARAAGINTVEDGAENSLITIASQRTLIFLVDGLEDIFQEFTRNERHQQALRVLLTDVLDWLRTLRGGRLGAVVFVRRDLVQWAVRQNTRQFLARYSAYELKWNAEEALRLALWVCVKAGAVIEVGADLVAATGLDLTKRLVEVWGEKMGGPKSREARSDQWFLAALSDFNQQIQARDIVTFLAEAARESIGDQRWPSRVLTPLAMRTALLECSRAKIAAIRDENPRVGDLLARLQTLPAEKKRIPFDAETVELTAEDLEILGANGVVFREEDEYWIPEIYRHGLGLRAVGRPRVLAVANLVRLRNNPS